MYKFCKKNTFFDIIHFNNTSIKVCYTFIKNTGGICVRILIIEDEYPLADAISETLKKENFNVDIVTDGIDGENEALTGIYDLILLDIMLPGKMDLKFYNQ